MRPGLAAIACICLALIVRPARADDAPNAILVLESGKVILCASVNAPNEPLDPRRLVDGPTVWTGNAEGSAGGNQLRILSDKGDVGGHFADGLTLAYTNGGQFWSTQMLHLRGDVGQIEYGRKILDEILATAVPAVTKRAQQLSGSTDGMRVTGLAVIDLDGDKTQEFLVAASSVPASSELVHPGQFAGIFVIDSSGASLGELMQVLDPEDTGTRLQIRLAAAGRNPFVKDEKERWDFLIETIYERSDRDGNQTQHRTVDVRSLANGKFVKRPNLSFETCTGPGC